MDVLNGFAVSSCRIILLLAIVSLTPNLSTVAQVSTDDEILSAELRRFSAMVARDTQQLRLMLDDALIYLHSNGLEESKAEHLDAVGSGRIRYRAMTREKGPRVRRYGKMALVNGLVRVDVLVEDKPYLVSLHYSAVYRRKKGRWVLLNWQSTRAQTE